jgi:hypothetical protein
MVPQSKTPRITYSKEILDSIAEALGGKFLDPQFKGTKHKHNWSCYFNHTFQKTVESIMQREWCPICSRGKSEQFCRFCFEQLSQTDFPPHHGFDWLRSPKGHKMELDGYSEALRLAFEYQGKQHYTRIPHFQPAEAQFEERQKADRLKAELCRDHGISLIAVPYDMPIHEIESFIRQECQDLGITVKRRSPIDFSEYVFAPDDILTEMRRTAEEKGGECLSKYCVSSQQRLRFRCKKHDYEWEATPTTIRTGRWCKLCGYDSAAKKNRAKRTIADMQELAAKHDGECLSEEYLGAKQPLLWKCSNPDHPPFWQRPAAVRGGHFCRRCTGKKRISIEDMKAHAMKHGGLCVTEELTHKGQTMVEFRCHNYPSHPSFEKKATYIKNNPTLWCPRCKTGKIAKHSLKDVQELAAQHGCECLSGEYKKNTMPLKWRCLKCNYTWSANLRQIQRKVSSGIAWCDNCLAIARLEERFGTEHSP